MVSEWPWGEVQSTLVKMTGETPEVRSDKRKQREESEKKKEKKEKQ